MLLPSLISCVSPLISAQRQGSYRGPYRNGSVFRDSLPLRCPRLAFTSAAYPLCGCFLLQRIHNGSIFRDSVPLRHACSSVFLMWTFSHWKVSGQTAFLHHLLIFVMCQPASEQALIGPASVPYQEGADRCGLSPSPCPEHTEPLGGIFFLLRIHNGSVSRDSMPLRCPRLIDFAPLPLTI